MLIGIDTSFLVQFEVIESNAHRAARAWAEERVGAQDHFAISPQVLFEFIHVVSDPKRFGRPLSVEAALARSMAWWSAAETKRLTFGDASMELFKMLMIDHKLGRKRILDTALAATFASQRITHVASYNWRDFAALGDFTVHSPGAKRVK